MSKLSADKKFYINLSVIIFFGLSGLGLAGWYIWGHRVQTGPSLDTKTSTTTDVSEQNEVLKQADKKLYQQCINTANKLYEEYMAKAPTGLSSDQYAVYRHSFADTRDNQKADCDRQYKD